VSEAAAARAAGAGLPVSLRCREISSELKKMAARYGMAGLGSHRCINTVRENGRRGRAGNAANSGRECGRDEGNGKTAGCHGSLRFS
jgi:hypothetical protein